MPYTFAELHDLCPACHGTGFGPAQENGSVRLHPLCQTCGGDGTATEDQVAEYYTRQKFKRAKARLKELPPDTLVKDVIGAAE